MVLSDEQAGPPWEPLLEGPLAVQAQAVVDELASVLEAQAENLADPSYGNGQSGIALFYAYQAAVTGDEQARSRAAAATDRAVESCASSTEQASLGFFGGLSGLAWSYRHVTRMLTGCAEPGLTDEVDSVIDEAVRQSPWLWEIDLFSGLVGLGIYALDHPDRAFATRVIAQVVTRLEELAVPSGQGLVWPSRFEYTPEELRACFADGLYSFGVAHGIAGPIGFLADCCRAGMEPERAERLLAGAVAWLLDHKRPTDGGSTFPAFLHTPESCRSAWCYGDPGISSALLSAARALGRSDWEQEALSIALQDCHRPFADCTVVDAQVCHGAAGLGHLYNRMYQATGDATFRRAATMWLVRTLDMRRPGEGLAGYRNWWSGNGEWKTDPGLLGGAAGIGLSLLAATSSVAPGWDRPFLFATR